MGVGIPSPLRFLSKLPLMYTLGFYERSYSGLCLELHDFPPLRYSIQKQQLGFCARRAPCAQRGKWLTFQISMISASNSLKSYHSDNSIREYIK